MMRRSNLVVGIVVSAVLHVALFVMLGRASSAPAVTPPAPKAMPVQIATRPPEERVDPAPPDPTLPDPSPTPTSVETEPVATPPPPPAPAETPTERLLTEVAPPMTDERPDPASTVLPVDALVEVTPEIAPAVVPEVVPKLRAPASELHAVTGAAALADAMLLTQTVAQNAGQETARETARTVPAVAPARAETPPPAVAPTPPPAPNALENAFVRLQRAVEPSAPAPTAPQRTALPAASSPRQSAPREDPRETAGAGDDPSADVVPPLRILWRDAAELATVARALSLRLAAVDATGRIIGEIDLKGRADLRSWSGLPGGYSNRVRMLSPSIFTAPLQSGARVAVHEIWIFVPAHHDRAMIAAQRTAVRDAGARPEDVAGLDGRFVRAANGAFRLNVTNVRTRQGRLIGG